MTCSQAGGNNRVDPHKLLDFTCMSPCILSTRILRTVGLKALATCTCTCSNQGQAGVTLAAHQV